MTVITYDKKRNELGMGVYSSLDQIDREKMGDPIKVFPKNATKAVFDTINVILIVAVAESTAKTRVNKALYHLNRWEKEGFKLIPDTIENTLKILGLRS